jgi:hypothetical protein
MITRRSICNIAKSLLACMAIAGLSACGGGGGGGGESGTTAVSAGGQTVAISSVDAATYMIGITKQNRAGVQSASLLGTGFAVGDNMIATNAHVSKGVLDVARQMAPAGEKIVAVTAYQSETGKAYPLLTAIVHPSYSGDSRSPDVGLFVTRDLLTAKLTLDDPEATTRLRKGDPMTMNGFPGILFDAVFQNFQPGLSVPKATLFTCNIQTIENFLTAVTVDPTKLNLIEMYQHGCDTAAGTSGSPMMNSGKVFGVHNAGITVSFQNNTAQGSQFIQIPTGVGSWGVHVKHLHNLIAVNATGVLEADKRYTLPPSDALVNAQAGGQSTVATGAGATYKGTANTLPPGDGAAHQIEITVAADQTVTGTSVWPRIVGRNWRAFTFSLKGKVLSNGQIQFSDNSFELANLASGDYRGFYNSANRSFSGQYYEVNSETNMLEYQSEWSVAR